MELPTVGETRTATRQYRQVGSWLQCWRARVQNRGSKQRAPIHTGVPARKWTLLHNQPFAQDTAERVHRLSCVRERRYGGRFGWTLLDLITAMRD